MNADYTIAGTWLKGDMVAVRPTRSETGYKTRAHYLAENMGRWVHRWNGYVMSRRMATLFEELYDAGWDGGCMGGFYSPDREHFLTLRDVKAHLRRNKLRKG